MIQQKEGGDVAYSELIKNFNRIREYMREFYVYGFKSREEYNKKSARSYDDERRRMESWLGDFMRFRQTADGKNMFLSIDSRVTHHNPLYKAWKAKSFTDGDITLHFIIFDILCSPEISLSLSEITEKIDEYLSCFENPRMFDESTVRKKLKEYANEGLVSCQKIGRTVFYSRSEMYVPINFEVLDFFSEVLPCGVVGSYLLDKTNEHKDVFAFKHHYITSALDSEIMYSLFNAMRERNYIIIETCGKHKTKASKVRVVPLKLMISVQNGRQYIMAYIPESKRINAFRTDNILSVKNDGECENFDELRGKFKSMQRHLWGVSAQSSSGHHMEHIEFTVRYNDDESYIHQRLVREKRCGTVEKIDRNTSRFSADVFDERELMPWIRTFICRIENLSVSNKALEAHFKSDFDEMCRMYGVDGGDGK